MNPNIIAQEQPRWGMLSALSILATLGLFVLAFDNGQTLSLLQGSLAFDQNLIHEIVHDARHAAGFPCH